MTEPEDIINGIRNQMHNLSPSDISKLDQLKASCGDKARSVLAYYLLAGLHGEKGNAELQEDAAIKMALIFKGLEPFDAVGIALVLAEIVTDFLLAQGDGTYAAAVARVIDPDLPLIPGRPNLTDDPLWRLRHE
jgi:hypothetical protein